MGSLNSSSPAYWEERYRAGDHPWDKGQGHPALEDWLAGEHALEGKACGWKVAVPGCGLGSDVRLLAGVFDQVLGLDAAPSATEQARKIPREGGETYETGSIFEPPLPWRGEFDLVVEHTLLCAIQPEDRPRYRDGVLSLLKPTGFYLAVFYRDPEHEPPGPPFGITASEIEQLFHPHFRLLEAWIPPRTFPGRDQREELRFYRRKN